MGRKLLLLVGITGGLSSNNAMAVGAVTLSGFDGNDNTIMDPGESISASQYGYKESYADPLLGQMDLKDHGLPL